MIDDWSDFFVATAGAGAALVGLIIVAVSVNLDTILRLRGVASRAGATVAAMTVIVLVSVAGLIPGQSPLTLGIEVILFAGVAGALAVDSGVRMVRNPPRGSAAGAWIRFAVAIGQLVPFVVGGAVLCIAGDRGEAAALSWISVGVLAVLVASVANTWVLMVEIRR